MSPANRLSRFEDHRFIGTRDDMRVYDCDDEGQFALLGARLAERDLAHDKELQTFAPDTLVEARNRCFRPLPH
jgi:hypothetical protein